MERVRLKVDRARLDEDRAIANLEKERANLERERALALLERERAWSSELFERLFSATCRCHARDAACGSSSEGMTRDGAARARGSSPSTEEASQTF